MSGYNVFFKLLDKGFVELFGPKGLTNVIYILSLNLRKQQTGYIYQYICIMNLSIILLYASI